MDVSGAFAKNVVGFNRRPHGKLSSKSRNTLALIFSAVSASSSRCRNLRYSSFSPCNFTATVIITFLYQTLSGGMRTEIGRRIGGDRRGGGLSLRVYFFIFWMPIRVFCFFLDFML